MHEEYSKIDLELEKIVFLFNASEGNPGIYELTYELACYNIKIEDKYKIAHQLLLSLINDKLVSLVKTSANTNASSIESISIDKVEEILNNPSSWHPNNESHSICLTEQGNTYLEENIAKYGERFTIRIFGKPR